MSSGRRTAAVLAVALLLAFPSYAASPAPAAVNWEYPSANQTGTGSVSQTQITASTVGRLQVAWVLPFQAARSVPQLNFTAQGTITPPLVVQGVVYVMSNDLTVMAVNAASGAVMWTYAVTLNTTGLPLSALAGHVHGITYYRGDIWAALPDCSALALDALSGSVIERIAGICQDIPGNAGKYNYSGTPIVFYGDTLVWSGSAVSAGTDAGRGFIAGYNLTTGALLWRWFSTPPAGGDPNWDADACPPQSCHGNVSPVTGDWGTLGYRNGTTLAGGGTAWDQMAVDVHDGLVFAGTSQPSPQGNATNRPGPNLFSDSIVALNASTGSLVWYYQTTPHDLFDFDCGWNVALANVTESGQTRTAVFKQCKNGYVYALDAVTGSLLWSFDPPSLRRLNTANAQYTSTGAYNGSQPWINYPSNATVQQCPGMEGGIESDIAVAYGKVFVATHNFCTFVTVGPVGTLGSSVTGFSSAVPDFQAANTTIYALDASTGSVSWSYPVQGVPYRGWLTATGGLVYASSLNGYIIALDAATGSVAGTVYVGTALYEGVTVGSTAGGSVMLFQLLSSPSYGAFTQGVPGALIAYGLGPAPPSALWWLVPWLVASALGAALTVLALYMAFGGRRRPGGPRGGAAPLMAQRS